MIPTKSLARTAALALLCVLLTAGGAAAFTIHGTVVNGTTGDKNVVATVHLVAPSEGMEPVQQTQSAGGVFTMNDVDASVPIYIVRVDYEGVQYMDMVRPEGNKDVDVAVSVYEVTTSWEGVHVLVPHIAAAAHEDHLEIEMQYDIHNHADPPRTIEGEDAQFRVYIPDDKLEITRSFVSFNEVPIDRFPVPTDSPGVYRIDYPIRPGETTIGVSYTVPYTNRTYSLDHKLLSKIEDMMIYAVSPGMSITSKTLKLGDGESVHDMKAWELTDLIKGTDFQLTFSGGQSIAGDISGGTADAAGAGGGGRSTVVSLPPRGESASFLLMVIMLLALLAFVGIAAHGAVNPLNQSSQVRDYYDLLLKRLAKLDDLNGAGMIAPDVYAAKRTELKNQLAALRYRLHTDKARKGKKKARGQGASAKVAGNERTSTP